MLGKLLYELVWPRSASNQFRRASGVTIAQIVGRRVERKHSKYGSERLRHFLTIQFDAEDRRVVLETRVTERMYHMFDPDSSMNVRYATEDPSAALLEGEEGADTSKNETPTIGAPKRNRRKLANLIIRHPVRFAAFSGAIASLVPPVWVLWQLVSPCDSGWSEFSTAAGGVMPPFMAIGAGAGALGGVIGVQVGRFLEKMTRASNPHLIGSIAGGVLGAIAGLVVNIIPSFMLAL
jgi:hypothetical protein